MAVTDLGPTQLKNIERPIRAYSLQVGVPAQAKPKRRKREARRRRAEKSSRLALLCAGVAALLVVISGAWYFLAANHAKSPEAARLSMVVLPFANLSGDPGQDYLVDALTDELTTALARLARLRGGFVIARNTAMTFKGKSVDVKAIGKDLGVRYVLEGSVQPSGNQVRVNAQLIDAESGVHLWAEQFDTPRADLLQTQDAIVAHLAHPLDLQLVEAEGARVKRTPVGQSGSPGFGSSMRSSRNQRLIRCQRRIPPLRTGARHRSQQCPRPDCIGDQALHAGGPWHFRRP